ncbi:MAG: Putative DNA-binding protein [uncultured Pseudonocardia sp.]|uniref:DNA-binding protein n=1 Tax=uncultured Pseudonocardia sp. TaxID=211455 RepID=A0A6J4QAF1_9PSEU|nr:MAG: Putative DNA-binding protein [uncultured Pseudonocardia sp.]
MGTEMHGSTVPRRQLGRSVREARVAAGFTVRAAAKALEWSDTKIWRIETGQVSIRSFDVAAMCEVYGVRPDLTDALKALSKETKARGWWHSYGDAIPDWFDIYMALEGAASEIRWYESSLVPGLCQTASYARIIMSTGTAGFTDEENERRVLVRMRRKSLVTRSADPVRLDIVIDEAALRRPIGGPGVMAAQCHHLAELSELENVMIRVLPIEAGAHHGLNSGPFMILRFPVRGDGTPLEPPTVFVEGCTGALYLDEPAKVARFDTAFTQMLATVRDENGDRSRDLLRKLTKEHYG